MVQYYLQVFYQDPYGKFCFSNQLPLYNDIN